MTIIRGALDLTVDTSKQYTSYSNTLFLLVKTYPTFLGTEVLSHQHSLSTESSTGTMPSSFNSVKANKYI